MRETSATRLHFIDPTSPDSPLPPPPPLVIAQPAAPAETPSPDLLDVFLTVVVAIVSLFVGVFFAMAVALLTAPQKFDIKELGKNTVFILVVQTVAYILTVGFMAVLIWGRHRTPVLKAIRWNMPAATIAGIALTGGAGLAFTSELMALLLRRWIPKHLPFDEFFKTPSSAYALAAFGILVAPLVEELFFRGFLYPALADGLAWLLAWRGFVDREQARRTGIGLSIVLTAGLFAMLHAGQLALAWAPLLVLFIVGTALTVVRARYNSVALCVLIHMGYNFTLFTMLFFSTGHFHHMEKM